MEDKAKLLDQLRIDRSSEPARGGAGGPWLAVAITVLLLAAAGGGTWWWFGHHGSQAGGSETAAAGDAAGAGGSAGAASAAGGAAAGGATAATGAVAGTAAGTAGASGASQSLLDASGYVVAQRQAVVSSKQMGKLVEVDIQEGQTVKAGDVLARLDDTNMRATLDEARAQVDQARATLEAAKVALADAGPIFDRTKQERAAGVISAQDFDQARATYDGAVADYTVKQRMVDVDAAALTAALRNEDDMTVRAPFTGVITVKNAQPGEMVSPMATGGFTRTGIGTLVDMDSLEVEVDVSENFINRVRVGMPAVVKLNAYPDWSIPAQVVAIIPTADRSKATVTVRVGFKQKDPRILPEMGARVSFLAEPAGAGAAAHG